MTAGAPLTCARVRVLLEAYVDGELEAGDPGAALAVRDHLAGCVDCRRQHDQARSIPYRLKALTSPQPRDGFVGDVMRSVGPAHVSYRRAWGLLAPEAVLAAFILWYLSGIDGLGSVASGIFGDLQALAGWGTGTGPLPNVPPVDVLLLIALIALTAIAGYHLSILIRLAPSTLPNRRHA